MVDMMVMVAQDVGGSLQVEHMQDSVFREHYQPFGWFIVGPRRCEDCSTVLPVLIKHGPQAGQLDTFPRCSAHAF
jgi:hypothetical protein